MSSTLLVLHRYNILCFTGGSASVITPTGSLPLQDGPGTFREQQVTTSAQVHGVPAGVQQQHHETYSTQQRQTVQQASQGTQVTYMLQLFVLRLLNLQKPHAP